MSGKPYDATTKELVEMAPADWLAFLGAPRPPDRVTLVDADLSTVTAAADKVIRVADDPPWLLHLEFQTDWDGSLPGRTLMYNALLQERHKVPVASAVVLLTKGANARSVTGRHRTAAPFGPAWEFRYTLVRLWEVPVDDVLDGPLALVPLAPLCRYPKARLKSLPTAIDARLAAGVEPADRGRLWTAVAISLGLRYGTMTAQELLESVPKDHPGRLALERVQRAHGWQDVVLKLWEKRFGAAPDAARRAIDTTWDFDKLIALADRAPDAASWDDLLAPQ